MTPLEAVRSAYKKHPVMEVMRDELVDVLVAEAQRGGAADVEKKKLKAAMAKAWAEDGLTLSERTTHGSRWVVEQTTKTIEAAIKNGGSVMTLAKELFDGYGHDHVIPKQEIPKFMGKLVALSKDYQGNAFKRALRDAQRNIDKLSTQGLKAAYNGIIGAISKGNEEMVDKAIYVATQEKARYFAERIARTEKARAYMDGVMYQYANDPDCIAFKWKLSSRHPCDDICDLYAHADLWSMGEGIFPKDKVPSLPVHPNCMCRLVPVFKGSSRLKSETPKDRILDGGMEYIKSLSKPHRTSLLGENGAKNVDKGGDWRKYIKGFFSKIMTCRIPHDIIQESKITKAFKDAGVSCDFSAIPRGIRVAMKQEVVDVLQGNPKFAEYVKAHGLNLKAEPLRGAYGVTSYYFRGGESIDISINENSFQDKAVIKKAVDRQAKSNFKMPASENEALHYTMSHELGHAIETVAVYGRIAGVSDYDVKSAYLKETGKIKKEIIKIARTIDSNVTNRTYKNWLSAYGQENPREFFAECHANMRCGSPNVLGKALEEWLRRWNNGEKTDVR